MAVNISSGSALGSTIQTAEVDDNAITTNKINNGAVTNPKIADGAVGYDEMGTDMYKWKLVETLDPSAASSISSAGDYSSYQEIRVEGWATTPSSSTITLSVRFNGDTGSNYTYIGINATPALSQASADRLVFGNFQDTWRMQFGLQIHRSPGTSSTWRTAGKLWGGYASGAMKTIVGEWGTGGSGNSITSMTFLTSASTFTGKIRIYAR